MEQCYIPIPDLKSGIEILGSAKASKVASSYLLLALPCRQAGLCHLPIRTLKIGKSKLYI